MTLWVEFKSKILEAVKVLRDGGHDTAADLLEEAIEQEDEGKNGDEIAADAA